MVRQVTSMWAIFTLLYLLFIIVCKLSKQHKIKSAIYHSLNKAKDINIYVNVHTYVHTRLEVIMYICTCLCIHIYLCTYVQMYIHMCLCIHPQPISTIHSHLFERMRLFFAFTQTQKCMYFIWYTHTMIISLHTHVSFCVPRLTVLPNSLILKREKHCWNNAAVCERVSEVRNTQHTNFLRFYLIITRVFLNKCMCT